jgi:hypothetical protein
VTKSNKEEIHIITTISMNKTQEAQHVQDNKNMIMDQVFLVLQGELILLFIGYQQNLW